MAVQIERGKGHVMTILSGKFLGKLAAGAATDAWVQKFGYGPKKSSETQSAFGFEDPVVVQDTYEGVKGSFDVLPNASNLIDAILTHQDIASAVGFDYSEAQEFFLVSNVRDNLGNYFRSHYLRGCKIVDAPFDSAVDGNATQRYDMEGTGATKFKYPIGIRSAAGTNTENQVLNFAKVDGSTAATAIAYKSNYALVVLKDGVPLVKTTHYTETNAAVTVLAAVPTTSVITVLALYDPAAT
jgi:hypothetical protein